MFVKSLMAVTVTGFVKGTVKIELGNGNTTEEGEENDESR